MKAAQVVAPRQIEIVETDTPDLSQRLAGSVLVKTHKVSLCGSDMPMFALDFSPASYPLTPGLFTHECIGVIAESNSDRFKEGDEVLSVPRGAGGYADYYVSDETSTVPLPAFDHKDHILMAQPLGTLICACRKLPNVINQDVVVVGQGSIGLLLSHLLSNLGAKTVIAVDLLDYRLAVSSQMGATHTINASKESPLALVADITKGRMADLVVEVVGHQTQTVNHCLKLAKQNGTVLAFGVPDEPVYDFDFSEFFRKNIRFMASVGPDAQVDYALAIDMIAQGRINVAPIITHHLPFAEAQRGYELSLNKEDGAIKVVFDFD
jgi:2-desacetyl-2-hydroxyethyl bacteriochlorophyllide A dehydrogenase